MAPDQYVELRDRIAYLKARAITTASRIAGSLAAFTKSQESFTPPEGVRSAAARGLALREKWGRGGLSNGEASDQGIGSGVQRAVNLKNGDAISMETVRRMHAFFSRHAKNYRPDAKDDDGGPTAGTIAWLLWGGNAGKAWAAGIVNRSVEKLSAEQAVDAALVAKARAAGCEPDALKAIYHKAIADRPADSRMSDGAYAMARVNEHLKRLRSGAAGDLIQP